eukprot:12911982-Prorocentrum_lima.AAC.1
MHTDAPFYSMVDVQSGSAATALTGAMLSMLECALASYSPVPPKNSSFFNHLPFHHQQYL